MSNRFFAVCVTALLGTFLVGLAWLMPLGCGPLASDLQKTRTVVVETRNATTQTAAQIRTDISSLPADDPVRMELERQLAKLDDLVEQADKTIERTDAALVALQTGDTTALREATRDVPYAGLVITLGTLAYAVYQQHQRSIADRGLKQTAEGINEAMVTIGTSATEKLKEALNKTQDNDVKEKIGAIKATLPTPVVVTSQPGTEAVVQPSSGV